MLFFVFKIYRSNTVIFTEIVERNDKRKKLLHTKFLPTEVVRPVIFDVTKIMNEVSLKTYLKKSCCSYSAHYPHDSRLQRRWTNTHFVSSASNGIGINWGRGKSN